jgi:hypothetical protein
MGDTSDISGAAPRVAFVGMRGMEREQVLGAAPQVSYAKRFANKPDSFCVHDIEGARPRTNHFRTSRVVNPLEPDYTLPSFEEAPFEVPRFIRDSFNVGDIEGTAPRQPPQLQTRNSYCVADIEGTNSSWRSAGQALLLEVRAAKGFRNPIDARDISGKEPKSRRCTDPLAPEYRMHGLHIGSVDKQRPVRWERDAASSLHTADIEGAQGGTASFFRKLRLYERVEFRDTNATHDIPGARPSSLKRGLRSKRQTNPLQPRYIYLHGDDNIEGGEPPARWGMGVERPPRPVACPKPTGSSRSSSGAASGAGAETSASASAGAGAGASASTGANAGAGTGAHTKGAGGSSDNQRHEPQPEPESTGREHGSARSSAQASARPASARAPRPSSAELRLPLATAARESPPLSTRSAPPPPKSLGIKSSFNKTDMVKPFSEQQQPRDARARSKPPSTRSSARREKATQIDISEVRDLPAW